MKSIQIIPMLVFLALNSLGQKPFECKDYDYFNKDTSVIYEYELHYDTVSKDTIKMLKRFINETKQNVSGLIDTVSWPRYAFHRSANHMNRLDRLHICCLDWLISNPVNSYPDKRKKVKNFVFESTSASVIINDKIIEALESEVDIDKHILNFYKYGAIRYIIHKIHESDHSKIQLAGLLSVNQLFDNNPTYSDQMPQIISEYQESHDKSILMDWIEKHK